MCCGGDEETDAHRETREEHDEGVSMHRARTGLVVERGRHHHGWAERVKRVSDCTLVRITPTLSVRYGLIKMVAFTADENRRQFVRRSRSAARPFLESL